MKNKEYRCINTEGVYNITEGEIYTSPGEVYSGEGKMSIYVINDNGDVAYYDVSRFVEVDVVSIRDILSMNDINGDFVNDMPIIASNLNSNIKHALDIWMEFDMSQYRIHKHKGALKYTLTLTKYSYEGSSIIIIEEEEWQDFVKKMNIITHGILYDNIEPDYWKDTYGDYIKANINNENMYNVTYEIKNNMNKNTNITIK
ncbi:MAG: hypothetical protein ACRCXT_10635 [Paraclostridium sp.]